MTSVFNIKGDKYIWAFTALLALFSFLPVYSASSNLAFMYKDGNTTIFLIKHGLHLLLGFTVLYTVHLINFRYWSGASLLLIPVVVTLLVITLLKGTAIQGANASRWIQVPMVGLSFQTSTLAIVVLMIYCARYLARIRNQSIRFQDTIIPFIAPIFIVCGLILPANFSTAAILFSMVIVLMFVGLYPLKYIALTCGGAVVAFAFFILINLSFPNIFPNRVNTWENRVGLNQERKRDNYQSNKAKIAIASGGVFRIAPGKSIQKDFLPQSSSDFIFAIIVEEWGIFGGGIIVFLYLLLLFRFIRVATKTESYFGTLLVVGLGVPIIFQAVINMSVAVGLLPVTGQNLPLISSGGSSIWMTCLSIGIILSVSNTFTEKDQEDPDATYLKELLIEDE